MPRTTFQPKELFDSRLWGFSQVSVSPPGRIVNIAGQVAWDRNHEVTAVGREAQLRQALEHVFVALKSVGGTPDDIQILRLYLPGFDSGPEADLIGSVLVDIFGAENPPPSSWIGVQALAQPEYLVEVEAMAVVPEAEFRAK